VNTIEERVKKVVVHKFEIKPEEATMEASFVDDLGLDSFGYGGIGYGFGRRI